MKDTAMKDTATFNPTQYADLTDEELDRQIAEGAKELRTTLLEDGPGREIAAMDMGDRFTERRRRREAQRRENHLYG